MIRGKVGWFAVYDRAPFGGQLGASTPNCLAYGRDLR